MGVAVVGCGYWGKNLIRNFHELNGLRAVCDPDNSLAEKYSKQYTVPSMTFDEVLSSDIEGVAIAAPAKLHANLAIKAFESNKNVYVEKPIALNTAEAKLMIEASKKADKKLMVGHLLQYHPVFNVLKNLNEARRFGNIKFIYSSRKSLGKIRNEEDVIWSFAPHDISMILSLVNSPLKELTSDSLDILQKGIPDKGTLNMVFHSGIKAQVSVSWLNPFKEQKLVVIGDKAMAIFDDTKDWHEKLCIQDYTADVDKELPSISGSKYIFPEIEVKEPLKEECGYFLSLIKGEVEDRTDGEEGLRVLEILELVNSH